MNKNKYYKLNYLSQEFYKQYPINLFPEIENKAERPYMVILVVVDGNTFAIPLRTNIRHSYCYKFKQTERSTDSVTGLDYTKAVIVNDPSYVGADARIDDKEYTELNNKYFFIISQFKRFVDGYIEYINGKNTFNNSKKYAYTTLKYFHNELGLK